MALNSKCRYVLLDLFGWRRLPGLIGYFDVLEVILTNSRDGVVICSIVSGSGGERGRASVQMAPTTDSNPRPVTAFLNRYGRRARVRAAPCRRRAS